MEIDMIMQEYSNEQLGEKYIAVRHPSGLKIFICPKPEYSATYAIFGTKYGSVDTKFRKTGDDWVEVPEGIAHFLEHKLFESEDGDAFSRYAKTGAYANAYTSFDRTCYLFSCTDNFKDSFEILLDFVQSPYFTKETVEKEQGIIGQEIRMYDDSAPWCVLFNLLGALYKNHPVKINIAGTAQSIAKIDDKLLYECYNTFYSLNNMFICLAGNVDIKQALDQIEQSLKKSEPVSIERSSFSEPEEVEKNYVEQKLAVSIPLFCLGFKVPCSGEKSLEDKIYTDILLNMLVGKASPLFKRLLDEGLINNNFGAEYFTGYGYAASIFDGESKDPQRVVDEIKKEISRLKNEGIDKDLFESVRKRLYGRALMHYNSTDSIASELVDCAMYDRGLYEKLEVLRAVTIDDVIARLSIFDVNKSALSVILPA